MAPGSNVLGIGIDPDDENHIAIAIGGYNGNKKAMESFNGGQTWSNISTGLPNVPATAIAFEGNGSEGIVKIEIYQGNNQQRKGARLLGLQVLEHVVYESEGGSSQPRSMFTDHSKSSGGSSSSTSSQEPQDSIPF